MSCCFAICIAFWEINALLMGLTVELRGVKEPLMMPGREGGLHKGMNVLAGRRRKERREIL